MQKTKFHLLWIVAACLDRMRAVRGILVLLMARKAAVIGSGGQLGVELVKELSRRGYETIGWDRSQLDITDNRQVDSVLTPWDPGIVFNAAAYNQVDVAESEPLAAFLVNALAVRNLALACRQLDARFVHFSTDYVFDGTAGRPYTESDATHPLGAYGVSKLAGEIYAQAYLDAPLIVRTSGVFGPGGLRTARGNFVEVMLRLARSGTPIGVVEDHTASPTYAPLLAARTIDLVERGETGVFHIGGGTPTSWYRYAQAIFGVAQLDHEVKLHATSERAYRTAAHRPKFSALSNSRMESVGLAAMPPLEDALRLYFAAREKMLSSAQA
jgi:dTDP-4-dehydrorhamnose reductase